MTVYKHVLVATDFSESSKATARRAVAIAAQLNAQLTLFHVLAHFPEDEPIDVIPPENVDPTEFQLQYRGEKLAELAKEAGCEHADRQVVSTTHSIQYEINHYIQTHDVDLIVLGPHERHMADWLTDNPDELVYSVTCDVLVVRSR